MFWLLIRSQAAISDRQFLRSMIPHHAGAILMCEQASIRDADIRRFCQDIVSGQQAEINQMKGSVSFAERSDWGRALTPLVEYKV